MQVLSENKCVSTRFELSIRCIGAVRPGDARSAPTGVERRPERERFPKEYICTEGLNATAHF